MDDADQLNCDDVVCDLGGHYACHDLPPPACAACTSWSVTAPVEHHAAVAEMEREARGDPPDSVEVSGG